MVALYFAFFIGIGFSAETLYPCYSPEVVDVDELITSKRQGGTYAGFMTFFRKFSTKE